MLCIGMKNNITGRHSRLPAGRQAKAGIQTPSPQKRGTIKMNWIPVFTGNTGFRIKCGMTDLFPNSSGS
ncbi:MAG TPA: hypothetical protein DEQ77_04715 [Candidatus Omnitrophica bacterium]|nr:hypothetical protein [Candidatus Omnitrophota bacterium]